MMTILFEKVGTAALPQVCIHCNHDLFRDHPSLATKVVDLLDRARDVVKETKDTRVKIAFEIGELESTLTEGA